jgi:hypothetical protein
VRGESIQFVSNKPINQTIESAFRPLELCPVPPPPPRLGGAYGLPGRRSIFKMVVVARLAFTADVIGTSDIFNQRCILNSMSLALC